MNDKVTYLSEIISALEYVGGYGSLKEINQYIEMRDKLPAIKTNKNWKRNVSATFQRRCKDTKSYSGYKSIFYSVFGIGEGYWGLVGYDSDKSAQEVIENRICDEINNSDIQKSEKEMLIKARIGQGGLREKILKKYKKCIITGISDERLLIASHIKPWRSADNFSRLSPENGILLSPLYDKLFSPEQNTANAESKRVYRTKNKPCH